MALVSYASGLLALHGVVEVVAGGNMVINTAGVFPFLEDFPLGVLLGQSFGVSLIALGLTALMSLGGTRWTLSSASMGAMCYNLMIGGVFIYQWLHGILMHSSAAQTLAFAVYHLAMGLLLAVVRQPDNDIKAKQL